MTFKDQLASDMRDLFADPAFFGETVTYLPGGSGGVTLNAFVERDDPGFQPAKRPELSRGAQKRLWVWIANTATGGRTAIARNDLIALPVKAGETPTTMRVLSWSDGRDGAWRIEVGE